ncbi:MAG: hypothetical protein PHX93_03130 [Candidatus Peribacteraceae bacterium]|nr:hypothetical protein [Candidatus Peribacteraceae bacterium]
MHRFMLLAIALIGLTPTAHAQTGSAASSTAMPGSGATVWEQRGERAATFGPQWIAFGLVHQGWITKWQKARNKLVSHIDRCHLDVRSANRDTLLPVTLQCYRGQLVIERDALQNERTVLQQWPGLTEAVRTEALSAIDDMLDAIAPVMDAIDAKVFPTLDAFRDVRENLRSQYRQPYWLATAHVRADAALTWLDHLLLSLHALAQNQTLSVAAQETLSATIACYEAAEPLITAARDAETPEESRRNFSAALAAITPCPLLLDEAHALQSRSSATSSH